MNNLLLINIGAARYGLWEDALTAVRGALPLHRLPLSPPAIAGISLLDDQSTLFADLAASLGFPPMGGAQASTFLIIDPREKIAGFIVEGEPGRAVFPNDQVLAIPASVRTQVIDTCIVLDGLTIPIINIRALQERLMQGSFDLPRAAGVTATVSRNDREASFPVRAFLINGERYCIAAAGSSFGTIAPQGIAMLPSNDILGGITARDRVILPLVNLDVLLGVEARSDRSGLLVAGADGDQYGVLVDEDLGIIEAHDLRITELPSLAGKPWMPAAAVSRGTVYPLIEADRILSERAGPYGQDARPSFTPGSEFPRRFRKGEVEVVEFSLLGAICAVPKDEVEEVLPLLPVSRIPLTAEIVMGVAEVNGELLPVLDLAAVFGLRSEVQGNWRLLRIANGGFHALVIAEGIAGDRTLSPDEQKQLPLALHHQELYGCYLADGMVRLIMNVMSLAVHFEKTAFRELLSGLSPMMAAPVARGVLVRPEPGELTPPEDATPVHRPLPEPALIAADIASQSVHRSASSEAAPVSEELSQAADAEQGQQAAAKAGEEALHQGSVDTGGAGSDAAVNKAVEEGDDPEDEGAGRMAAEQTPLEGSPVSSARTGQDQPHGSQKRGKYRVVAAVLAAALALIGYVLVGQFKTPVPPAVRDVLPPVAQDPSPPIVLPKKEAPKAVKSRSPMPETLPPLYLTVPPERVVSPDQEVYSVVKGDTLWGIAKRFTGDPHNYPRVARDSSIATPDLIFPGQRIRLVQQKR